MEPDQQSAITLRDRYWNRLSGPELAVCELVADGHELVRNSDDCRTFRRLLVEFAREIGEEVAA